MLQAKNRISCGVGRKTASLSWIEKERPERDTYVPLYSLLPRACSSSAERVGSWNVNGATHWLSHSCFTLTTASLWPWPQLPWSNSRIRWRHNVQGECSTHTAQFRSPLVRGVWLIVHFWLKDPDKKCLWVWVCGWVCLDRDFVRGCLSDRRECRFLRIKLMLGVGLTFSSVLDAFSGPRL